MVLAGTAGTGLRITGAAAPAWGHPRLRGCGWLALAARPPWSSPVQHGPTSEALPLCACPQAVECLLPRPSCPSRHLRRRITSRAARLVLLLAHSDKSAHTCSAQGGLPLPSDRSRSPPTVAGFVRRSPNCVGLPTSGCCSPAEAWLLLPLAMRALSLGVLKDLPSTDNPSRCPLPRAARDTLRSFTPFGA
jgi:hypothetical protein